MGRRVHAPVRGSHGYYPRARASSITPRVRSWPKVEGPPRLLGFPVFKVGMTHTVVIEPYKYSPLHGQEVVKPVTILEAPPVFGAGLRLYGQDDHGALVSISEVMLSELPKHAERLLPKSKKGYGVERVEEEGVVEVRPNKELSRKIEEMRGELDRVERVRLLALTQPHLTGIGKKKPDLVEIEIGGSKIDEKFEFAVSLLGREIHMPSDDLLYELLGERLREAEEARRRKGRGGDEVRRMVEKAKGDRVYLGVFSPGFLVDVVGVTKGKGFQGVIKRFGVKEMPRWHKHRKGSRKVGSAGPATPGTMRFIPRAGQLGFHRRVEYNKRIIMMGVNLSFIDPELGVVPNINPKSGFKHYGVVRNDYLAVLGSVMGPPKRMLMLRYPIRPGDQVLELKHEVLYVHI